MDSADGGNIAAAHYSDNKNNRKVCLLLLETVLKLVEGSEMQKVKTFFFWVKVKQFDEFGKTRWMGLFYTYRFLLLKSLKLQY